MILQLFYFHVYTQLHKGSRSHITNLQEESKSDLCSTVCCSSAPNFPFGIIKVSSHLFLIPALGLNHNSSTFIAVYEKAHYSY